MGNWDWGCFDSCGDLPTLDAPASAEYFDCFQACLTQNGWKQADDVSFALPLWAALLSSFFLVLLSGLFSGLTLGLLSLDLVGLRVRQLLSAARVAPSYNPVCTLVPACTPSPYLSLIID